jgi:hypothetical protein
MVFSTDARIVREPLEIDVQRNMARCSTSLIGYRKLT